MIWPCLSVTALLWLPLGIFLASFRPGALRHWPVIVFFQTILLAILVGIRFPDGAWESRGYLGIATVMAALVSFRLPVEKTNLRRFRKAAIWVLLAVLLGASDYLLILGKQGWEWEKGRFLSENYFRGAFLTDAQRNLILVESVLRGGQSPFLPEFPLRFQLLPFKWIAFFTSDRTSLTRYSEVQGISAALGLSFFLGLAAWILAMRPRALKKPWVYLLLIVGVFSHSDWLHLIFSRWEQGNFGLEADGSYPWFFFRYYSLKLMALLSPHHTFFALSVLGYVWSRYLLSGKLGNRLALFFVVSGLSLSPPLGAVLWSSWAIADHLQCRNRRFWWTSLLLSLPLASFLNGYPIWQSASRVSLRQADWALTSQWRWLPLLFLGALGFLGVGGMRALTARQLWKQHREWAFFLLVIFPAAYLFKTGAEVQRHLSLLASLVAALAVGATFSFRRASLVFYSLVLLAVSANAVFVYRHTGLPSDLDPGIPWRDYFEANEKIRREMPGEKILGAITASRGSFPLVMEAATSFSTPMDVFIYHETAPPIESLLYRAWGEYQIAPYAEALGYRYLLWGPAESRAWGERVRERFAEGLPLWRFKEVALYRFKDRLKETSQTPEKIAEALFHDAWNQEAFDYYAFFHRRDPRASLPLRRLSMLWKRAGNTERAKEFLTKATSEEMVHVAGTLVK